MIELDVPFVFIEFSVFLKDVTRENRSAKPTSKITFFKNTLALYMCVLSLNWVNMLNKVHDFL